MPYQELSPKPLIIYAPPSEGEKIVGYEEPRLQLAVTVMNKKTGESKIIINSTLPEPIRRVLLRQERVQYEMIQKYSSHGDIENMMPYAHYAGLDAGLELAIELGVVDEFLRLRDQGETVDSIRNAIRP